MVRPKPGELLGEVFVDGRPAADQVLGQLGGNAHLVPDLVLFQRLAQACLAAGVDVGGVKVVDAKLDGPHQLPFRFLLVDGTVFLGKAHTAEAQSGDITAQPVLSVLHRTGPLSIFGWLHYTRENRAWQGKKKAAGIRCRLPAAKSIIRRPGERFGRRCRPPPPGDRVPCQWRRWSPWDNPGGRRGSHGARRRSWAPG